VVWPDGKKFSALVMQKISRATPILLRCLIFALLVTVTHLILYMPSAWFKVPPYLSAEHSTPSS
jgi:hypothetical protein